MRSADPASARCKNGYPARANPFSQETLLHSAADIGGGVARGVWAGIELGVSAAGRARNVRLAKSAPVGGSGLLARVVGRDMGGDSEARFLTDEVDILDAPDPHPSSLGGGHWVKVIDLFPRGSPASQQQSTQSTNSATDASRPAVPRLIAHFRLPPAHFGTPSITSSYASYPDVPPHLAAFHAISHLSFSPLGLQLFASASGGRIFHIFDVHPAGADADSIGGECTGEAWHLYELQRGTTPASVSEIIWDQSGRWIGVGTARGTVRQCFRLLFH